MIELSGISKRYGKLQALDDVSFTVEKGQIVGFLGANGAGKTTTMDIMCGCIGADAGSAKIAGYDIMDQPIEAKGKLGYLPDTPPLYYEMKVREYIEYVGTLHGLSAEKLRTRTAEVVDKLELVDVLDRLVGNLSKGYRQRVAIAQALVHDPEVLVLDEPTEGLDPNQIAHTRELIRNLKGQHTIILSSHILSEVQNICDSIVIINKGKIVSQGTHEQLIRKFVQGTHYRLKVARDANTLLEKFRTLPELVRVEPLDNTCFEFVLGDVNVDHNLETIEKWIYEGKHGLRELSAMSKSLEDIFFQVTH